MSPRTFAIGLGSNMGNRLAHLSRALALIDRIPGLAILATSRIYESKGWGRDDLDPFLNAVLVARSVVLSSRELLLRLQEIEDQLGRQRTVHWGPRTLDLDLLAADSEQTNDAGLSLPHPFIADRPFVYLPFREVQFAHPAFAELCIPSASGRPIEVDSTPLSDVDSAWGMEEVPAASALNFTSYSPAETEALARTIAPFLLPGDTVALNAPMGSGKSVFARGIARGLGVTGAVSSPTYLLCKTYETQSGIFEHWDYYRLESLDDLESTGFTHPEARSLRVVEWADKFPEDVSAPNLTVEISHIAGEGSAEQRELRFSTGAPLLPFPLRAILSRQT